MAEVVCGSELNAAKNPVCAALQNGTGEYCLGSFTKTQDDESSFDRRSAVREMKRFQALRISAERIFSADES